MSTKIEWTDETWNPITGCTPISPGCAHCYAKRMAKRLAGRCGYPAAPHEFDVTLHPEKLYQPLHWKKPRRVFICSMSDLFHEDVPFGFVMKMWKVMSWSRQHTFQILTKRPDRMMEFFSSAKDALGSRPGILKNVWLGVTAENQEQADKRIPVLLKIPAAVRFVSIEPMLGPVDFEYDSDVCHCGEYVDFHKFENHTPVPMKNSYLIDGLDWVIVGGETGPGARPMHPDWVRDVRDQCQAAGVPFFFKRWGGPHNEGWVIDGKLYAGDKLDGKQWHQYPVERG